jgi:hypothetical protein
LGDFSEVVFALQDKVDDFSLARREGRPLQQNLEQLSHFYALQRVFRRRVGDALKGVPIAVAFVFFHLSRPHLPNAVSDFGNFHDEHIHRRVLLKFLLRLSRNDNAKVSFRALTFWLHALGETGSDQADGKAWQVS